MKKRKRRSGADALKHAETLRQVAALYAAGATFEAIGLQLGKNKGTIYKWWREVLEKTVRDDAEAARFRYDLSTRECIRVNATIMADPNTRTETKIRATEARARIEFQRSQVLGFAMATKTEVSGLDGGPITLAPEAPTPADARRVMQELFGAVTPTPGAAPSEDTDG